MRTEIAHRPQHTDRLAFPGVYLDFSKITRRSLQHTLAEAGLTLGDEQTQDILKSYDSLSTFPDVQPMLEKLKSSQNLKAVIFSNGTHEMVFSSVNNSPDLSPHAGMFDDIVVVEECRKFKPAPEVYHHLAQRVGKEVNDKEHMEQIWLISGNPFDIVGGRSVGMNAILVDRAGNGWQDALMPGQWSEPTQIVRSMDEVVTVVTKSILTDSER